MRKFMPANLFCLTESIANRYTANQTEGRVYKAKVIKLETTVQSYPCYSGYLNTKTDFRMCITPSTYLHTFEQTPTSSTSALSCITDCDSKLILLLTKLPLLQAQFQLQQVILSLYNEMK